MRPVVGITGGVGCGKSEVGRILQRLGVSVLDTDAVVHHLLREDPAVFDAVTRRFGEAVRKPNGGLDRRALAERVFAEAAARAELESILHPRVRQEVERWRVHARSDRGGAALIPLLFEAGFDAGWDAIWCVVAREDAVDSRLSAKGWDPARIAAIRGAQWPVERKAARSDVVVENNGSIEDLAALVTHHWRLLERRSTRHVGRATEQ